MSDVRSRWWPDVRDIEGRRAAAKAGFLACMAMAVLNVIGIALLLALRRSPVDGSAVAATDLWGTAGSVLELAVFVVAGPRLRRGKGLVWGAAALILFVLEIAMKLASGTGVTFIILFAVITLSLVNGLRGAWAERVGPVIDRDTFA